MESVLIYSKQLYLHMIDGTP